VLEVKKSQLRVHLERVARNQCDPPLPLEQVTQASTASLMSYISRFRCEEELPEQTKLDFELSKPIESEIESARSIEDLKKIYDKYFTLRHQKKFIEHLSERKKKILKA